MGHRPRLLASLAATSRSADGVPASGWSAEGLLSCVISWWRSQHRRKPGTIFPQEHEHPRCW
jgi:hypothetical protein